MMEGRGREGDGQKRMEISLPCLDICLLHVTFSAPAPEDFQISDILSAPSVTDESGLIITYHNKDWTSFWLCLLFTAAGLLAVDALDMLAGC